MPCLSWTPKYDPGPDMANSPPILMTLSCALAAVAAAIMVTATPMQRMAECFRMALSLEVIAFIKPEIGTPANVLSSCERSGRRADRLTTSRAYPPSNCVRSHQLVTRMSAAKCGVACGTNPDFASAHPGYARTPATRLRLPHAAKNCAGLPHCTGHRQAAENQR